MTLTIEIEVSESVERFTGIELSISDQSLKWHQALLFVHRPQKVRNGKHIKYNQYEAKIIKVGDR